jgi:putative ABC transport system permease protein
MFFRNLKYAARTLLSSPVFAIASICTIAVAIGASTAVFSVANDILFRPLPYHDPDRLILAYGDWRKRSLADNPFSITDILDLRAGTTGIFEDVGAVTSGRAAVPAEDGSSEQVRWATVTPNFFRLMGARIVSGRDFVDADGQSPAATGTISIPPPNALATILSYGYWQRRFGGSTTIFGRPAPGTRPGSTEIVGVLAPGFELLFPSSSNIEQAPDVLVRQPPPVRQFKSQLTLISPDCPVKARCFD